MPISSRPGPSTKLKSWKFWLLVASNIVFLLVGQAVAVILGRFYYDRGGKSKWISTVVQTAAFPIHLIPYFFIRSAQIPSDRGSRTPLLTLCGLYFVLGALISGDNVLFSTGLLYLSASTYSLLCATQLAFNAVFSLVINHQKFTILILNSVVILSFSTCLLAVDGDSNGPSGLSKAKYIIGFVTTLAASCIYSLLLSLMQLSFQKIIKKETFSVVLEMQIFTAFVATCFSVIGLFGSGEWKTLHGEMSVFSAGKVSYVLTLFWTSIAWQTSSISVVSLIFLVSSLFSNVISTLSLAVTPIVAVIVFHEQMNGVKIIALLMAFWGFASYIYQNFMDDVAARKTLSTSTEQDGPDGSLEC